MEPAVTSLGLKRIRSDKVEEAGLIHQDVIRNVIEASVEFLKAEPTSKIEQVAFLAWTTTDLDLLRTALQRNALTERP